MVTAVSSLDSFASELSVLLSVVGHRFISVVLSDNDYEPIADRHLFQAHDDVVTDDGTTFCHSLVLHMTYLVITFCCILYCRTCTPVLSIFWHMISHFLCLHCAAPAA